jgi:hypothetical protein
MQNEQSNAQTEQPEKDSGQANKDQVQNEEQSEQDSSEEQMVEVDGKEIPLSELKKGYMRHSDYTKKTQEIAEIKRKGESSKEDELPPEAKAAIDVLKKAGFATKEDLQALAQQQEDQKQFRKLIKKNPELAPFKEALQKIGMQDNRPWDVLAKEYGFLKSDKLSKVKRPLVGNATVKKQSKSMKDASMTEYQEWRKTALNRQD